MLIIKQQQKKIEQNYGQYFEANYKFEEAK